MKIVFQNVSKAFERGVALRDLSFAVREGEILALLGRSGSGKTTALRLINRLIDPTDGTILLDGKNLLEFDQIELRRQIGYSIQHIGLFSHMTVEENIGIVPLLLGWSQEKIKSRTRELFSIIGLEEKKFASVFPSSLSGGQKQRVGVARALAADPPIILMDEPFGALDPFNREQLQNEFLHIQSKIQKTVIFVTHDLSEAVKMGNRIAILDKGKLLQIATPEELIHNPASDFIDQFLGKDRFQLLLQTKSFRAMRPHLKPQKQTQSPCLPIQSSLMDAIMVFKVHKCETLAIFDEETYIGEFHRNQLLETIFNIL